MKQFVGAEQKCEGRVHCVAVEICVVLSVRVRKLNVAMLGEVKIFICAWAENDC